MDVHTPEVRSYNMASVHSEETKPEQPVRKYLFSHGFRYRKNAKDLIGSPDVVLPKYRTVIFVNGCFWHGHTCPYFHWPKTNETFWREKINRNIERDNRVMAALDADGWKVLTVWECELKGQRYDETMQRLIDQIKA